MNNINRNLVGRKIKGFAFDSNYDLDYYTPKMDHYLNMIGTIRAEGQDFIDVEFPDGESFTYPKDQIENHLLPDEPTIPQLGKGILMEVSSFSNFKNSKQVPVFGQTPDGGYLGWKVDDDGNVITYGADYWPFARPIQDEPIKEYTLEELKAIVGHDFKLKEDE